MNGFEEWVRARSLSLARSAYLLTTDRRLAEDLVQATLARVAQRWTSVRARGDPDAYARTIMHRLAAGRWRRRGSRRREVSDEHRPELSAAGDPVGVVARRVVLRGALAALTPRQRAVVSLRFYEDLTEVQAAEVLGCTVGTVTSQTRRALERLGVQQPGLVPAQGEGQTAHLRELLDELAEEVPAHVVSADAADVATRTGRRRRRRAAVGLVVGACLVLAPVGAVQVAPAGLLPSAERGQSRRAAGAIADGHPVRVALPWWSRSLTEAPGPMAGVLFAEPVAPWRFAVAAGWYAVSPTGRLWRLPTNARSGVVPGLSPDGRWLAYADGDGSWVVHDLVGGRRVRFADLGVGGRSTRWAVDARAPVYWSPDATHLLVRTVSAERPEPVALVLGTDGSQREVPEAGHPSGWAGVSTLAWLATRDHVTGRPPATASLVFTDLAGVRLRGYEDALADRTPGLDRWSVVTSADGRSVLVSTTVDDGVETTPYATSSRTIRVGESVTTPGARLDCQASVGALQTGVTTTSDGKVALAALGGRRLVLTDPRLGVGCLTLARDAVDGTAHRSVADRLADGGLIGLWSEDGWVSWHLRELGLGLLALGLVVAVRRRRAPPPRASDDVGGPT